MTKARRLSLIAVVLTVMASVAAIFLATPASAASVPCSRSAKVCLDLSSQRAWLLRNGVVIYGPVRVKTGRPSMPTPPGTFHVTFKDRHHVSSVYHVAMPYAVFFHGGDAFHEGSLRVSSHGCVHLSAAAAAKFFNTLHVGDTVQVVR